MISTPFCFYLCFFAMEFFFFSGVCWIMTRNVQKQEPDLRCCTADFDCTTHSGIPLFCALHKYGICIKNHWIMTMKAGISTRQELCYPTVIKIYKWQVLYLNCSTRDGNEQAKFTLLCHMNTSVVHKISLKSCVRRISPYNPISLLPFQPNVMVNYAVIRFSDHMSVIHLPSANCSWLIPL